MESSDFTPEEYMHIARRYCELMGQDPDELVQYPDPNGYAVARRAPRWRLVAVRAAVAMAQAIEEERRGKT